MRKRIFTSTIAALALFAVVGLIAALAPSLASLNLARAHSPGGASLTALTVTSDATALTLTPTFSSTVHYYTIPVAATVTQITIEATPEGDGTVAYKNKTGTALPDADANTPRPAGGHPHGRQAHQRGGNPYRRRGDERDLRRVGDPRRAGGT